MIVDDDVRFTRTLLDAGHARGFKCLIALRGATALSLARKFKPAAVTLDIELPDLDGWKVLDALKHDPSTRHIPVHIISVDDRQQKALELGAVAGLTKPVTKKSLGQAFDLLESFIDRAVKNLLVVESDPAVRVDDGRVDRRRRRSDDHRLDAAQKRWPLWIGRNSTAWCSTWTCRI